MKTVNKIISVNYDRSRQKISAIKFSIGPLSYHMRMDHDNNTIIVTTYAHYTFLSEYTLQIKDFVAACRSSYKSLQYDFDKRFSYYIDVDSFLHVIYPNIENILKSTHYTENDSIVLFADPKLDASKLNEFVSNSYLSKCFPSTLELIVKNNNIINTRTNEIKQAMDEINNVTRMNEVLTSIGRIIYLN